MDKNNRSLTFLTKLVLGLAASLTILHHRPYRRNLLFASTLLCLLLVFVGAVFLTDAFSERPLAYLSYWSVCFFLAGFVLLLAIYDLLRIRRDHQRKMDALDQELEEAAEEAQRLAEENLSSEHEKM